MKANTLVTKIVVASLSSPLEVGANRSDKAAEELTALLEDCGCEVYNCGVLDTHEKAVDAGLKAAERHVNAVVFASASWFEDYLVLDFIEECSVPILFWALPGMETGALCGTQQITCYLKQLEQPFHGLFGKICKGKNSENTMKYLRAAALHSQMRRSRIGITGTRLHGMTHTSPNEFMLKKSIGPRIVPFDLARLLDRALSIPDADVEKLWKKTVSAAFKCCVPNKEGMDSLRVYTALKEVIEQHGLNALTVGCFPHLMGKVCLAASRLADDGIPFACEGDLNGGTAQLILALLTGKPTHHTDLLDPTKDGAIIYTHCGSGSFSLAENPKDITLDSVRLMGQGVCALFPAKTGPVTLLSLIPTPSGYQCAVLEGEAEHTEMVFPGNPVKVRFKQSIEEMIQWIFDQGIGHHWMIGYGHVADEVRTWAKIAGNDLQLIEF